MKIHLKDKNGVTLNTAKKYCEEDIEVRVDTQELNITPSAEVQIKEGLYDKVTVAGDSNLVAGNIKQGTSIFGVEGTLSNEPVEKYIVRVIDYDGTIIKEEELAEGEVFTMPDEPQHDNLIFEEWSSPVDIVDNKIVVKNHDVIAGPIYTTRSGASEFDIELTRVTGLDFKFQNLTGMTSIDWGDGTVNAELTHTYANYGKYTIKVYDVTTLAAYMFRQSSSVKNYTVKNIRLANGITGTGTNNTFRYCYSLINISLPKGLWNMGGYVFGNCYSLKNLILPKSIRNTPLNMCLNCLSLKNVVLPKGITNLSGSNFSGCYSLENITLPEGITTLGNNVFLNCYSLRNVVLLESITEIGSNSFSACYSLTDIVIPENVTSISSNVFSSCYSLRNINLPKNITSIGGSAFSNCYSLTNTELPEGVTNIGSAAFSSCHSLTNILIPENVTSIESYAFSNCEAIMQYDFTKVKIVPTLENINAFAYINQAAKIIVPDELYEEWIAATNWSEYADYIYKASEVLV